MCIQTARAVRSPPQHCIRHDQAAFAVFKLNVELRLVAVDVVNQPNRSSINRYRIRRPVHAVFRRAAQRDKANRPDRLTVPQHRH